ncbi:type III-B CRISPR module RAMP protein Cmr1 [Caldanaerobacter subterraneus]|uniref:CRISPR-associated Cmr1 family protein n=1 Tax=Caldanaerobacter subterraneus TaxID=911092 RepID=A0A4R2JLW6_9THEO|nr:type III-B CRISPR module RAMP protein Cmr1 [Caldanaerobacter subterraneus]TCO60234.1 CRISPR-associated Cmr1 family protein [Caldanaerobacter subterraneus]
MKKIKLTCKVITPMFMYGINKERPELRASEIKGMMRFWWRAIKACNDVQTLKEEESEIFGDVNKISSVKIKIFPQPSEEQIRENVLINGDAGVKYLFYSALILKNEGKHIKEGFTFHIVLEAQKEKHLKEALASLWSGIYLGGFGGRSRRGGGNITATEIEGLIPEIEFIPRGENSEEVAKWLIENFKKAKKIINESQKTDFAFSYSNLSISRFIISDKSFDTWEKALADIGNKFREFRKEPEAKILGKAVFGLPVFHRRKPVKGVRRINTVEKTFDRRMSPLIFKILNVGNKYYWAVIRLAGEFLPEGTILKSGKTTQKPDYSLIEKFWEKLKAENKEYVLSLPETLNDVLDKIKSRVEPKKIYLYGSRARGDFGKKSDIDIAVETDKSIENIDLIGLFDIVNLNKVGSDLREKILKEGILLYERKS